MGARPGQIFIFGGASPADGGQRNLNDAYRYDIRSRKWTRLQDLPGARRAWSALVDGENILLFGGYTAAYERDIYTCDPDSGRCPLAGRLPAPRAAVAVFRIGH